MLLQLLRTSHTETISTDIAAKTSVMRATPLIILLGVAAIAGVPRGSAQGCCGDAAKQGGCTRESMSATSAGSEGCGHHETKTKTPLPAIVQTILAEYGNVRIALVEDSTQKLKPAVQALAKAVSNDYDDLLPAEVSQTVSLLEKAPDLVVARSAFKGLSEYLIRYLHEQDINPGRYREAYCGMAQASWLQTGTTLGNPYMGKDMPTCGRFRS